LKEFYTSLIGCSNRNVTILIAFTVAQWQLATDVCMATGEAIKPSK